jgi:hypothetical protein
MVHFNGSSISETEDLKSPESEDNRSEDDTAKVNELLRSVEQAITFTADKLASLPSTPQSQESSLPQISRQLSLDTRQVLTPPVSKGKQLAPPPLPPQATSSGLSNPI